MFGSKGTIHANLSQERPSKCPLPVRFKTRTEHTRGRSGKRACFVSQIAIYGSITQECLRWLSVYLQYKRRSQAACRTCILKSPLGTSSSAIVLSQLFKKQISNITEAPGKDWFHPQAYDVEPSSEPHV